MQATTAAMVGVAEAVPTFRTLHVRYSLLRDYWTRLRKAGMGSGRTVLPSFPPKAVGSLSDTQLMQRLTALHLFVIDVIVAAGDCPEKVQAIARGMLGVDPGERHSNYLL